MNRTVTQVTADGSPLGEIDIVDAHKRPGILHRAFSVFIFSEDGSALMLQKRFSGKPTFGSQWGNTCCSHQYAGEDDEAAGMRRLQEEMGFTVPVKKVAAFTYQADDPRGTVFSEHEHDTILVGTADTSVIVTPNPAEAEDWKWMSMDELRADLAAHREIYVPWLPIALAHLP